MDPEQAEGRAVSVKADIFSVLKWTGCHNRFRALMNAKLRAAGIGVHDQTAQVDLVGKESRDLQARVEKKMGSDAMTGESLKQAVRDAITEMEQEGGFAYGTRN